MSWWMRLPSSQRLPFETQTGRTPHPLFSIKREPEPPWRRDHPDTSAIARCSDADASRATLTLDAVAVGLPLHPLSALYPLASTALMRRGTLHHDHRHDTIAANDTDQSEPLLQGTLMVQSRAEPAPLAKDLLDLCLAGERAEKRH